jgi:hypothetical protein
MPEILASLVAWQSRYRTTVSRSGCISYTSLALVPQWTPGDEVIGFVCGHWLIKDRLHRVRNMDRNKERTHVRTSNGPRVTASVRNLAITILRPAGETGIGTGWRHHAPGGRLTFSGEPG